MTLLRNLTLRGVLAAFLVAPGATAALARQTTPLGRPAAQPPRQSGAQAVRAEDRKPAAQAPPTAQYDIGHIVKRLAALEAQVADLKKRNDALEAQVRKMEGQMVAMKLQNSLDGVKTSGGDKISAELKRLDAALRSHTHSLNSNIMALSAVPGMQDLANKAGIGHVIQQWQNVKMLWTSGNGPGLTSAAIIQ